MLPCDASFERRGIIFMNVDRGWPSEDFERHKLHSEQLVTLIVHAVGTSQAWLRFLITVQGALAAGFGFLVLSSDITATRLILSLFICIFGIVLAFHLVKVIVRHQQWQGFFIKKYVALPINSTAVFPEPPNSKLPTSVSDVEKGVVAKTVEHIRVWLVILWLCAALLVIGRLVTDYRAGDLPL